MQNRLLICLLNLSAFRDVLVEYYHSIGTDGGVEEQAKLRNKVKELLVGMGMSLEELAEEEHQAAAASTGVAEETVLQSEPPKGPISDHGRADVEIQHQGNGTKSGGTDASMPPPPSAPPTHSSHSSKGAEDDDMDMDLEDGVRARDGRRDDDRERHSLKNERGSRDERDVGRDERKRQRSRSPPPSRDREKERDRPRHEDVRWAIAICTPSHNDLNYKGLIDDEGPHIILVITLPSHFPQGQLQARTG